MIEQNVESLDSVINAGNRLYKFNIIFVAVKALSKRLVSEEFSQNAPTADRCRLMGDEPSSNSDAIWCSDESLSPSKDILIGGDALLLGF